MEGSIWLGERPVSGEGRQGKIFSGPDQIKSDVVFEYEGLYIG